MSVYFFLCVPDTTVKDEIINAKMAQNEAKYPVEKARGSAAKYDQLTDDKKTEGVTSDDQANRKRCVLSRTKI